MTDLSLLLNEPYGLALIALFTHLFVFTLGGFAFGGFMLATLFVTKEDKKYEQ